MIEAVIIDAREAEYAFCVAEWPDFEDTWRSALRNYFELAERVLATGVIPDE